MILSIGSGNWVNKHCLDRDRYIIKKAALREVA
jgi:hypothetical protein